MHAGIHAPPPSGCKANTNQAPEWVAVISSNPNSGRGIRGQDLTEQIRKVLCPPGLPRAFRLVPKQDLSPASQHSAMPLGEKRIQINHLEPSDILALAGDLSL